MDDDEPVLGAMRRLLEASGCRIEAFSSGRVFLDALRDRLPDCVLLDLHMLGMTGEEVHSEMLASGFSVPVIFISGDGDLTVLQRMANSGAAAFLRKPFSEQKLFDALAVAIGWNAAPPRVT